MQGSSFSISTGLNRFLPLSSLLKTCFPTLRFTLTMIFRVQFFSLLPIFLVSLLALTPTELRTDRCSSPLGIDSSRPELAWKLRDEGIRNERQSAYQIQVSSTRSSLEQGASDLWDSGKVSASAQSGVPYKGLPLTSFTKVFWRLRVWDGNDRVGAWSELSSWTMGALSFSAWNASWITDPALLELRRTSLGFHSEISRVPDTTKWLVVDLGVSQPIDEVVIHAMAHSVPSGFGFPRRFRIEISDTPDFSSSMVLLDQSGSDYPNSWATKITAKGNSNTARYVRVYVSRLRIEDDGSCRFALSQLSVRSGNQNVAFHAKVSASDSLETPSWSAASVTDGLLVTADEPRANSTLLVRREFTVKPSLRRALLLSCGLGHYEASLNGRLLGKDLFSSAWTRHEIECLYDTREVTESLLPGVNVLGFTLTGGFYNLQPGRYTKLTTAFRPLTLIASLRLEYADGSVETIGTDHTWQLSSGPISFSNMYGGEEYDARHEPHGWDQPGFASPGWRHAVLDKGPGGVLKGASESAPPIRLQELLQAKSSRVVTERIQVYDLGQNASIIPRIRIKGPAGASVRLIPGELLGPDGRVDQRSALHGGSSYCTYTLSGSPEGETWHPHFFYHGARYLQLELCASDNQPLPAVLSVEGMLVHSDSTPIGDFECSNELFNRIRTLVRWAQRSNSFHVFTDCPHRERLGWIEQYYLNGPSLRYEFDYARLFRKGLNDMSASQTPEGLIPSINPEYVIFPGGFRDSPEWGSACILAAWQQYEWTADRELLAKHYESMRRYIAYLRSKSADHILSHGLGDWYDLGPKRPGTSQLTPVPLSATALYFTATETLSRISELLGRRQDASEYRALAEAIRNAFNARFLNVADSNYGTGSQTSNALALALGLVPSEHRQRVLEHLVDDIHSSGDAFTTGDVGYRYLLRALAEAGRSDLIFSMNNQSEKPGYGYQLAHGCTSLAESWDAESKSSQNHFMLGQITEWFYGDLAGIKPDPSAPGFAKIIIAPTPVGNLSWVRASLDSPRGLIRSSWRLEARHFTLEIVVPPNATARVTIPRDKGTQVLESNAAAANQPGVRFLSSDSRSESFTVSSGNYRFESSLAP